VGQVYREVLGELGSRVIRALLELLVRQEMPEHQAAKELWGLQGLLDSPEM